MRIVCTAPYLPAAPSHALLFPTPPPLLNPRQPAPQNQAEAVILERDVEIARVVETITELAQIMRDMSSLIVEQGTMLDRIDHNIVETAVKVEQGVKELVAAEKTQKAGTMMLCIIVLMVAVVLMMIAVIIRHH